jgi:hypothetical protein
MVSSVVNVFEETTKSVSRGRDSITAFREVSAVDVGYEAERHDRDSLYAFSAS